MAFYLEFTLFVCIDYAASMSLMFSVFKFNPRGQYLKIACICVLLSQVSYVLCEIGWVGSIPIIAVIVWMLGMWLLFRLRLIHAALVTVCTYLTYGFIQGSLIFVAMLLMEGNPTIGPMLNMISLLSATIATSIAYYVRIRNLGFSFVPEGHEIAVTVRESGNKKFLLVLAVAMSGFLATYAFTAVYHNVGSFLAVIVMLLPTLGMLFYMLWMKEIQKFAGKIPVIIQKRFLRSGE